MRSISMIRRSASTRVPTSWDVFRSEMSASASAMPMSDPSPRYASEGDETRARFRRSPSPVTQNVSVPEKILEHWASLCVAYRYRSLAAQWWPVNGVDIDLQALPAQPGKAIQLELKTMTPAGPGRHKVNVDLGQLWEYSQKPLARQPFYAFPRPHWDGELAAAARADGQDATELAVQRSKTGWWFGDWMVVMTTQQVVGVLRQDLNAHLRRDRGVKRCLVQFDISDPGKPEWGDPASSVPPS